MDEGVVSYDAPLILTEEDTKRIQSKSVITDFKRSKLEMEAMKNWDKFYRRNSANFFKDRHWSRHELLELCPDISPQEPVVFLEAGCGVGNMVFPIAEYFPSWQLNAFDFSANAIKLLDERSDASKITVNTAIKDLTEPSHFNDETFPLADLTTLVFVLSSIHPDKHTTVIRNLTKYVKCGGLIIVRDYGVNDHAMVRFAVDNKLADRFYVRQDGTRAYFFYIDELKKIFTDEGYEALRSEYLFKNTQNRLKNLCVDRVFVQAVFRRIR
ncbi:hypothetical protein AB6A40_001343 [Gnathostoma spinigerum]|uniref:tRNA N(3)-methylcytidine methyltransferase n=1 Tax=Gnathostoma spinigerum TaxID=75299 RepID=A0ABD6E900_9BILA